MKVEELRVGNYVQIDDLPIEQITLETFATLKEFPATISVFNPIPLTEEWLLKFGFVIRDKTYSLNYGGESMRYAYIEKPDFVLYFHGKFGFNINEGRKNGDYCINSVNQLQNLYFYLTGNELIIKQPCNQP